MPRAFRPNLYRTIKVCIRTEKRAARRIFFLIASVPLLASSHYAGGAFRRLHVSGAVGRSDGEQDAAARARSAQPPRLFGACAAAQPGWFFYYAALSRCMFYSIRTFISLSLSLTRFPLSLLSRVCSLGQYHLVAVTQGNNDAAGLMTRREEARLARLQRRQKTFVFEDD